MTTHERGLTLKEKGVLMGFRDKLANLLLPVSKLVSKFHRPETDFSSAQYIMLKSKIQDFDVLVSRTEWEMSNLFLPGKWKHCAIYRNGMVFEATTHGVRCITLEEFVFKKDKVGLCRANASIGEMDGENILHFLYDNMGEGYDYTFDWGTTKQWYCSKYVYFALCEGIKGFAMNFHLSRRIGETDCAPDDIWAQLNQVATYE